MSIIRTIISAVTSLFWGELPQSPQQQTDELIAAVTGPRRPILEKPPFWEKSVENYRRQATGRELERLQKRAKQNLEAAAKNPAWKRKKVAA